MYRTTFKIEYFETIMDDLFHDRLANDALTDAFNILFSMFNADGTLLPQFSVDDDFSYYCRECYAKMEDISVEELDDNLSYVIELLLNSFLDNICGFYGHPPAHSKNVDSFLALLNLYYDKGSVVVMHHEYNIYDQNLKVFIV